VNEHSPLSHFDEYPIHQFPQPLRVVATSDARAYERYWFAAHDLGQQFMLVVGFGFYPNLGTADAYAIFVHGGVHTTVRAHRLLGDDRSRIETAPLRAEIVEAFREWHLTVGENPQDLLVDIRWQDTKRAVFHQMGGGGTATNRSGRLTPPMVGYETFGRAAGTVSRGGETFELTFGATTGSRDHHWGMREGVGGPGHLLEPRPTTTHLGQWIDFGTWSIWGSRVLYNLGDARAGAGAVTPLEHRMSFEPETNHLLGGVITNRLADGTVKTVTYEPAGDLVAYLRCGMYYGVQGGTPEEDYYQGTYVGDNVVGGESYTITDPATRIRIGGFEDRMVVASCDGERTVGILECRNPLLYQMCRDGHPGFGMAP